MSTSITLNCSCGRQLQARADAAGKRVRCPYCDRTLAVPVPTMETALDLDTMPAPPARVSVEPTEPASPPIALEPAVADGQFNVPELPREATSPLLAARVNRRLRPSEGGRPPEYRVLSRKDDWFQGDFHPNDLEEALNSSVGQGWVLHTIFTIRPPGSDRDEVVIVLER